MRSEGRLESVKMPERAYRDTKADGWLQVPPPKSMGNYEGAAMSGSSSSKSCGIKCTVGVDVQDVSPAAFDPLGRNGEECEDEFLKPRHC